MNNYFRAVVLGCPGPVPGHWLWLMGVDANAVAGLERSPEKGSRDTVVPDSGTDELEGLAGKMTINIVDGRHLYNFEYTLGEAR